MTFGETLEWQRCNSWDINRMAKLGEPLAKKLISAYVRMFDSRLNIDYQHEWMKYCDEFSRRDLIDAERYIVQNQYGHKVPPH